MDIAQNNIENCINNYTNVDFSTIEQIDLRNIIYKDVKYKQIPFTFKGIDYKFECYIFDETNKQAIIYLNNINSIITDGYSHENGEELYKIDVTTPKMYCIELLQKYPLNELWINFIQNKPDCRLPNIQGTLCKGLGGIIKLIFNFLNLLGFKGNIFLEDDSQIFGQATLIPRILTYYDSIYAKYGFELILTPQEKKEYFNLRESLCHTQIPISNTLLIHTFLPEEVKAFENKTMSLYDLCYYLKSPKSSAEGIRNNNFYVNLPQEVKAKILQLKKYYSKMKNSNYIDYLNCNSVLVGGNKKELGILEHKYIKYKTKYMKTK